MAYAIIAHEVQKIKKTKKERPGHDAEYGRTDTVVSNKKMIDEYRKALSKTPFEEIEVPPYKRHHFDFLINNNYFPDQILTVFLW